MKEKVSRLGPAGTLITWRAPALRHDILPLQHVLVSPIRYLHFQERSLCQLRRDMFGPTLRLLRLRFWSLLYRFHVCWFILSGTNISFKLPNCVPPPLPLPCCTRFSSLAHPNSLQISHVRCKSEGPYVRSKKKSFRVVVSIRLERLTFFFFNFLIASVHPFCFPSCARLCTLT